MGLGRPGSGGLWPVWNSECTNLFPALVMVSPAPPRKIPGAEHGAGPSAPGTSCVSTAGDQFGPVGFSGKEHSQPPSAIVRHLIHPG